MAKPRLPSPVRQQLKRYGHHDPGEDANNCSNAKDIDTMRTTLDNVQESLNNLSDSMKNRFRELLVSQMSLIRNREPNADIKALPRDINNHLTDRHLTSSPPTYAKRRYLKSVSFPETAYDIFEDDAAKQNNERGKKSNLISDKNVFRNDLSPKYSNYTGASDLRGSDEFNSSYSDNTTRNITGSPSPIRVSVASQMRRKYGTSSKPCRKTPPVEGKRSKSPRRSTSPATRRQDTVRSPMRNLRTPSPGRVSPVSKYSSGILKLSPGKLSPRKQQKIYDTARFSGGQELPIHQYSPNGAKLSTRPTIHRNKDTSNDAGYAFRRLSPTTESITKFKGNFTDSLSRVNRKTWDSGGSHTERSSPIDKYNSTAAEIPTRYHTDTSASFGEDTHRDASENAGLSPPRNDKESELRNNSYRGASESYYTNPSVVWFSPNNQKNTRNANISPAFHENKNCTERIKRHEVKQRILTRSPREKYCTPDSFLGSKGIPETSKDSNDDSTDKNEASETVRDDPTETSHAHSVNQIGKKILLNGLSTLICVVQNAVTRMFEEDFDLGIWTAIHKNVNDLEEELNKFYNSFTSDQILPPKTAMAEADGRIQTRLNVLFYINNGRTGFSASDSSKQDIMEAIQLLKSSAYRAGVDSQNDMLVKEMRYILAEIRNLSECFQVCGTRFVKRVQEESRLSMKNIFGSSVDSSVYMPPKQHTSSKVFRSVLAFVRRLLQGKRSVMEDYGVRRSSSLEALEQWIGDSFDSLSNVQRILIIICFIFLIFYLGFTFFTSVCAHVLSLSDIENNLSFCGSSIV